ncbi:peroxisomal membrane anchor protein conserved region-domain-containing protein [Xylariaceae sp. FL0016]|nr:peroxisomal membrane anchor protein conserved region-domain-containing protein [Xylariaceae sp. FL0016]
MSSDEKKNIPAWQQSQAAADAQPSDSTETTLDQARTFLDDETVRNASAEKKREFLKSKGFDDAQIRQLLNESEHGTETASTTDLDSMSEPSNSSKSIGSQVQPRSTAQEPSTRNTQASSSETSTNDTPPIITYPEFLTKSQRPPPLITPSRLANILTVSGSVWTLLYGTARFVVNPMVETLNDSRSDYYTHVNDKLDLLVEKLEGAASEVPYKNGKPLRSKNDDVPYADDESTISDPTELFHRDIGTQTSPPATATPTLNGTSQTADKPIDHQARRLASIQSSLRELTLLNTQKAENTSDLNSMLREIRDEVDKLAYPPTPEFSSTYGGLGYGRTSEPDDEVKKTKDAIRSVKGVFLSARSFPTATAR